MKLNKPKDKPEKKKEDWISLVKERLEDATNWGQNVQMYTNASYFIGNQWIFWDQASRQIKQAPPDGQVRITYNKVRPRVMTLLSKLTKSKIKFDVMPDTPDQERIEIAKAAQKFLDYLWNELDMNQKTKELFLYNLIYGWCAAKVYFDPDKGTDITPGEGEQGYEDGMKSLHTGEIQCRICDPLTLYIDPGATSEDEIRWIIERKPRDVDYILSEYGVNVEADDNVDYLSQFDINSMAYNQNSGIGMNQSKRRKNMVMLEEMWIYPCKKYPNGVKVTTAGGKLLDEDTNAGQPPYVIFKFLPVPSRIQGEGLVKDMIPVQKEINIARTMIATHMKRMGNTFWLVPIGSNVDEEELNNEEGAIIHYSPDMGQAPSRVPPTDLPSFFDRYLGNLDQDVDDMSGAREISQGSLPKGLDTASGLQMMIEQENEKLTVASHNYEQGMKKLLQKMLMLMQKHYTEERQARILGDDNEVELLSFTGADLSGGEDINIVEGSSLPESKAAQEERIMNLWSAGAIITKDGRPDSNALLKMLGMGDSAELFEQKQLDENKAKQENKIFEKLGQDPQATQMIASYNAHIQAYADAMNQLGAIGETPEQAGIQPPEMPQGLPIVREFYDHEVHIYIHNLFRKSHEYEQLPPDIQQLIDAHVEQHIQALQAPMIEQQQQQQQMMQQQQDQQAAQQQQQMAQQHNNQQQQLQIKHQQGQENMQMKHQMDMQKQMIKPGGGK
jgi:hypothetical protein